MSVSVLERMFANALSLAEQHLRAEGRIAPMLYFSGPGGEAVLRLDLSTPAEEGQLLAKATLMATALRAEACTWIFEGLLVAPGAPVRPSVVVLGEDRHDAENAAAEAWRELEAMGVNRSDGRRPVH